MLVFFYRSRLRCFSFTHRALSIARPKRYEKEKTIRKGYAGILYYIRATYMQQSRQSPGCDRRVALPAREEEEDNLLPRFSVREIPISD